jgi:hypothetical protein
MLHARNLPDLPAQRKALEGSNSLADLAAQISNDDKFWQQMEHQPDLQALVERYGGYPHISPETWERWDVVNAMFQVRRRPAHRGDEMMKMKVIRVASAGKPQRIICTGCGKKAFEAGIAFKPETAEEGHESDGESVTMIDESEHEIHPLCEECVTALLQNEETAS